MKIEVFEPSSTGDISTKKITEFKFDMNQFSVVDRVNFFKKASEFICSDLINVFVTKENLQRDYKRIENKLKVEIVEKQALQVKKSELKSLEKTMEVKQSQVFYKKRMLRYKLLRKKLKCLMMQELKQLN